MSLAVSIAQVAAAAERFEDVVEVLEPFGRQVGFTSDIEVSLLLSAGAHITGRLFRSWHTTRNHLRKVESQPLARTCTERYQQHLATLLRTKAASLSTLYQDLAVGCPSKEWRMRYFTALGDLQVLLCELGGGSQAEAALAVQRYEAARAVGEEACLPTHPEFLRLALHHSCFLADVLHAPTQAVEVAGAAYRAAIAVLQHAADPEADYSASVKVLDSLIRAMQNWQRVE
jgi:hypothetical protein